MLHFLIGLALCIWIAERIAHYWGPRRERRRQIRNMREGLPLACPWMSPAEIDEYINDVYGLRRKPHGDKITTTSLGH